MGFLVGDFGGEMVIPEGNRSNPFDTAGSLYGMGVTGVTSSEGSDEGANLHLLSEFLAGSMTTSLICTAPSCIVP